MKVKGIFKFNFVKVSNFDKSLLFLILLCVFYIYKTINFPIHDFSNYYFGGKFLVTGNFNSTIYFPYEFNKAISDLGYSSVFTSYAPNTPCLALFFIPFSLLPIGFSKILFNCISSILFIYSIYQLFRFYKIDFKYLLLLPILFFVPIKNNLLFGQVYFLIFYLLTEFWLAFEKNKLIKSSVFLSFAILLKVFPIFFVLVFLFKKQYKFLIYTFIICVFVFGISCLFTGFEVWFFYLQNVLPKASNGEIATAFVDNYQSVFMFLKRLLVFDLIENPVSFFNTPKLFSGLVFGFKITLITIGYYISKKVKQQLFIFSYWILATILISPYGSTYTFLLLIFPLIAILKSEISNNRKHTFLILLFLTNNFTVTFFIQNIFPFSYFRLFFLLLFFGIVVSIVFKKIQWGVVLVVASISVVSIVFINKNETLKTDYLLDKNAPILIYDYKIENQKLTYFYWKENGENSKSIPFKHNKTQNLEIVNKQIFYNNKQLTFDTSNKLKPILIDDKTLLFLSDYDRGLGFYALKEIKIKNLK